MKRVSFNSHQSPSFDEGTRNRHRHQSLLQDYLELQKDFVSSKKKLQIAKQKRETLLTEVRFLSHRHAYLLKMRASKTETEIDTPQNFNVLPELSPKKRNIHSANEAVKIINTKVSDTKQILKNQVSGKETIREAIRIQKKPKNCVVNGKRAEKKKISVQDQLVLEA